ncbi:hypothetical protein PRIC2_001850 [Phytophthora ramorum]
MAFYWECEALQVAVAPWHRDPKQQQLVTARVAVAEQRTPGFALRFDLELPAESGATHLMRLVNQRQMLRAFEFAFVGLEVEKRRAPGGGDADLDSSVKKWLAGGGHVQPPPKEKLARWLLAWMLVARDKYADEWLVLLCGETGAEEMEDGVWANMCYESGDCNGPVSDGGSAADDGEDESLCDDGSGGDTENEDLPPPYGHIEAREAQLSEYEYDVEALDRDKRRTEAAVRPAKIIIPAGGSDPSVRKVIKRGSSIRIDSRRSVDSGAMSQKAKSELKPTIVRLNLRQDFLDAAKVDDEPSSEWSEDRRHFQQELRASRRDVQVTKQQREKMERLAQVRHTQLLKESARKLRANEQKRRDAKAVRQMIADTLEYRDELHTMESRAKQASIAAHRDQERVKRLTQVVVGNTETRSRGVVKLGPGPLSKKEREILYDDARVENAVYDLHGRRHNLEEAEQVATECAFKSAMGKLRRVLLQSENTVDIFRRYDLNRSGSLSYAEFQRMLREVGTGDATVLTQEQSEALFKRFDADDSGEVDYAELLWRFFDCEAFLKRWHERKSATTTAREVLQVFQRFDRASQGVLPLKDFQLVIDFLGVTLGGIDAKLMAVKFDAGKDGCVDYHKFLEFVNLAGDANLPPGADKSDSPSSTQSNLRPGTAPPGMERIWKELESLSATQAKLHRLLRK